MPKGKKPYKKFYKRFKKYKKGKRKMAVNINKVKQGGFPDVYFTDLVWRTSLIGMGDNTAVGYARSYSINDPTAGNINYPQGWTILREVYDVCLVHACKVTMTFQNTSTTVPCRVVIVAYDPDSANWPTTPGPITLTQFNTLAQSAYAKEYCLSVSGGGKDIMSLKSFTSIGKFAGHANKLKPNEDRFVLNTGGTNSTRAFTAPVNQYRLAYAVMTSTGANLALNQVVVTATFKYYCQFIERLSGIL